MQIYILLYLSIIVNNSLLFLDSLQFCRASLDSLAGNLEDNDFKHLDNGKRGKGDGHISNEKYLHLKNVWNTFNSKTFKDFHDHYLKKDALLLTDVFEKFIDICLKNYGLETCHSFSAPGLSWDAMLKMAKIELEKISNADIHLFIQRGMRGEISYINKRYSKVITEYCSDYGKHKPKVYINYRDMNNLYGKAMSEYFPYGGFKWLKVNNKTIN